MATIGFTGTRAGMNQAQKILITTYLKEHRPDAVAHGDCIGADKDFDDICADMSILRYAFPGDIPSMRANTGAIQFQMPKPPLERNKDIVHYSDEMLACPKEMHEVLRSGTWATIRAARRAGKRVHIFYRDGTAKEV